MNCRNCLNFKPERKSQKSVSMEAADEFSSDSMNMGAIEGKCTIADRNCRETDKCDCGGFVKRK